MTVLRRFAFTALAASTVLALAACGSKDDSSAAPAPTSTPVAPIAAPAGQMWSDVVAATDEGMRMGNPDAPIKLVEYGSLSCPHCAKLANEGMKSLVDKYVNSGRVSYEFRSYPIHGIIDVPMTMMVRCADPAAFFPLIEQIYANQPDIMKRAEAGNPQAEQASQLPPNQRFAGLADAFGLTDWFAARGLSKDQAHACLANTAAAQKIAEEGQKWNDAGINSTPTLQINGATLQEVTAWAELEPALQNAGAR